MLRAKPRGEGTSGPCGTLTPAGRDASDIILNSSIKICLLQFGGAFTLFACFSISLILLAQVSGGHGDAMLMHSPRRGESQQSG